jgi:DNA-directed RNA polymerase specialized sigma24 family protein
LHYLDDRPYDEIAVTMGVPLNTVKSHILRGKERMSRLLDRPRFAPVPRFRFAGAA